MTQTNLSNLINPELFADALSAKLGDAIKLYPISYVQNFEGKAGGTISVPSYTYIGDADVIGEGVAIDPSLLSQGSVDVPVVKLGKAVNITDEAVVNGFGNPVMEAEKQLLASIASGVEKKMFDALASATLVHDAGAVAINMAIVADSLALFGEEQDGEKYLLVNPTQLAEVRKDSNFINSPNNGSVQNVGSIFGCTVVVSNRVQAGNAYIVKPEAVALYMKKQVQVETDRDILAKATVISADNFFATHLRDASKAIKISNIA